MKTKKLAVTMFLLLLGVVLTSCNKASQEQEGREGYVRTTISADSSVSIVTIGTKAAEPVLTPDDFKVRLENTKGEILRQWDRYADVPNPLRVVLGSYKLVAWYGDGTLPAFDQPYYEGVSKFAVTDGATAQADLTCGLAAVKINVTFKENFKKEYKNYSVDMKTTTDEEMLTFVADDLRDGYFKPGSLRMKLTVDKGDGVARLYYPKAIPVNAKDYIHLYFDVNPTSGSSSIIISTDESTNDIIEEIDIPSFMLPKPAPDVRATGFSFGAPVATTEGVSQPASVSAKALGGIKKFEIKHTSSTWTAQGIPAVVDLVTADADMKAKLKALGLTWTPQLDKTPAEINSCIETVYLTMNNAVKLFTTPGETESTHEIEVSVTDMFDQKHPDSKLVVKVAPPIYELETPTEGNVFATRAQFNMSYTTEIEELKPVVQYKKQGGAEWLTANATVLSDLNGKITYRITGLDHTNAYVFRGAMAAHAKDQEYTFTTETPGQVQNAGMEEWNMDKGKWRYFPWSGSSYWDTNNLRSTAEQGITSAWYSCMPTVSYVSDAHSGSRAAEIRSTGAAYGNTISICNEGSKMPGVLFMGSYSYSSGDGNFDYGRPFAVRPTKLQFWYKYVPYENDEFEAYVELQHRADGVTTVLGTGVFTTRPGGEVSTYTLGEAEINYTDFSKRATHMFVRFKSSTKAHPVDVRKDGVSLKDIGDKTAYVGSVLKVDDITLVY